MTLAINSLADLEAALAPYLSENDELGELLAVHTSAVLDLVDVPLQIEVGVEHWRAAVALATAFVDGDLFVSELSTESRLSSGSPARRAAVIYALVQLTSDVLMTIVDPDDTLDEQEANKAALALLARLALVRGVA